MSFLSVLLWGSLSLATVSSAELRTGVYEQWKEISLSFFDKRECKEYGGLWREGLCFVSVSDEVTIGRKSDSSYRLQIDTVANDFSFCRFEAPAEQRFTPEGSAFLVARLPSSEPAEPGFECRITVPFYNEGELAVIPEGDCRMYCGEGGSLAIPRAKLRTSQGEGLQGF
jgi:hypothetical protein